MTARFAPDALDDLPPPARRYLRHAMAPGVTLASRARLSTLFVMRLRQGDGPGTELRGHELLAPDRFTWRARARLGGLPVRVTDDYTAGRGSVRVDLFGLIPIVRKSGPDVTRSARGRLVGEAIWLPSALHPSAGAVWDAVDSERARVTREVDGEPISLTLRVDAAGRLVSMEMLRHGDVRVDSWRPIPFGIEVQEESTFGGYTVPARAVGGWWFGSDRYEPDAASVFRILSAEYS